MIFTKDIYFILIDLIVCLVLKTHFADRLLLMLFILPMAFWLSGYQLKYYVSEMYKNFAISIM